MTFTKVTVITNSGGKLFFDSLKAAQRYINMYGGSIAAISYSGRESSPRESYIDLNKI